MRPRIPRLLDALFPWLVILWLGTCWLGCALAAEGAEELSVQAGTPATLTFWNRPIVTFHAEVEDVTPAARVDRVQRKIALILAQKPGEKASAIPGTLHNLAGYWVRIDGQEVFGLLPEDADSMTGQTLDQLVKEAVDNLQRALDARREQMHLTNILKAVALAAGATLVLSLAIAGALRLHRRSLSKIRPISCRVFRVGGVDIAPFFRSFERGAIRLTTFGLIVIAIYSWAAFVFHSFPYTKPWGEGLSRFFLDLLATLGTGITGAIPGLFTVLVIFVLTRVLARMLDNVLAAVERGALAVSWLAPDTAKATRRLTQVLVWVFALSVAYPYIPGSGSDAFKGISVFVGLMISLGSAGLVNQVMSGLVVIYSRALKAGEYVRIGETEGTVTEVGLLSAKVATPKREAVTVPNAVLVSSPIVNYSRLAEEKGAAVGTGITIGYDTAWRQVHAMLEMAARRTPGVRSEPAPFVLQRALSDFYVEYHLVVHLDRADQRLRVLSELHANIQDVFNEYGVQIMSPNFRAQPEVKVWVPKDQWYPAPVVVADMPGAAAHTPEPEGSRVPPASA